MGVALYLVWSSYAMLPKNMKEKDRYRDMRIYAAAILQAARGPLYFFV